MEIQGRFNQFWIMSAVSSHYKTMSILHSLYPFYIVVYDNDVGLQLTLPIVNPTDAQFKND